jgi:hypothetical protein
VKTKQPALQVQLTRRAYARPLSLGYRYSRSMAATLYFAGGAFEFPEGSAKTYSDYMAQLARSSGRGHLVLKNGSKLEIYLARDTPWAIESDES